MSRLSLRYEKEDKELIEEIKKLTGEATANKAVMAALRTYPALVGKITSAQQQAQEAKAAMRLYQRCIKNFIQSHKRMEELAKDWIEIED